jgi:hypothetical protein
LVKAERVQVEEVPGTAWLTGLAAWFIPGLGHILLKRGVRAILMGGAVWVCFFVGLAMGGHLFDFDLKSEGSWIILQGVPMIGNIGTGALYIVSWILDYGFADDPVRAARATYEYGNIFLLIAGLLNYLNILDAFDIAAGRKP